MIDVSKRSGVDQEALKARTKDFALRVIRLVEALPRTRAGKVLGNQLLRSATSVGANYRAALRARSKREFAAKIGIVVEEADECCYWLELITAGGLMPKEKTSALLQEADELTAIFVATRKTAQHNKSQITNQQSHIRNQQSQLTNQQS